MRGDILCSQYMAWITELFIRLFLVIHVVLGDRSRQDCNLSVDIDCICNIIIQRICMVGCIGSVQ